MDHDGFSFIECLSECVEFYEGAFDASNPRKGGVFNTVPAEHDVTDEVAAYKLAGEAVPRQIRHLLQGQPRHEERERSQNHRRRPRENQRPEGLADSAEEFRPVEITDHKNFPGPVERRGFFIARRNRAILSSRLLPRHP